MALSLRQTHIQGDMKYSVTGLKNLFKYTVRFYWLSLKVRKCYKHYTYYTIHVWSFWPRPWIKTLFLGTWNVQFRYRILWFSKKKSAVSFYSVSAEVRNIFNIICIDTLWPFWPCPRAKTPSHKRVIKFIIFLEDCTVNFSI